MEEDSEEEIQGNGASMPHAGGCLAGSGAQLNSPVMQTELCFGKVGSEAVWHREGRRVRRKQGTARGGGQSMAECESRARQGEGKEGLVTSI